MDKKIDILGIAIAIILGTIFITVFFGAYSLIKIKITSNKKSTPCLVSSTTPDFIYNPANHNISFIESKLEYIKKNKLDQKFDLQEIVYFKNSITLNMVIGDSTYFLNVPMENIVIKKSANNEKKFKIIYSCEILCSYYRKDQYEHVNINRDTPVEFIQKSLYQVTIYVPEKKKREINYQLALCNTNN